MLTAFIKTDDGAIAISTTDVAKSIFQLVADGHEDLQAEPQLCILVEAQGYGNCYLNRGARYRGC
jgi:hypothetical protein